MSHPSSFHARVAALVIFAGALLAVAPAAEPAAKPPLNVLFIVADDLNTALGAYGDSLARTPNLDRLAARGVRFANAHVQYPLCNPSRVSFFTGRRPEHTGVYTLTVAPQVAMPDSVRLPQLFRQHGYFTAGAGKVYHNLKTNDPASWDQYEDGRGGDRGEQAALEFRASGNGTPSWHPLEGDGSATRDGQNARTIARLIRERAADGKPFFLALGLHKPHLPWTAPKRFFDLHDVKDFELKNEPAIEGTPAIAQQTELTGFPAPASRAEAARAYYACVSFMDEQAGIVLDELERQKLTDRTIVVFVSDNGFHLGDHGGLWAKFSAYHNATRVPLIIAAPGWPAGKVLTPAVELLDLYPTLAELAHLPPPAGLEGRSLSRVLAGEEPAPARSLIYHYDVKQSRSFAGQSLITAEWRFTRWAEGLGEEFYRLTEDPGEYRNRIADSREADAVAHARLLAEKLPIPKPGPVTAPRALAPSSGKGGD
jgi:uncharacterized sulfatase